MEEQAVTIKMRNEVHLIVPKRKLTADSVVFRYLLDELKYDEHEMEDFSTEAVFLFLDFLEIRVLGEIEEPMFREINKLATVFEIGWMKESCFNWLRNKIEYATMDDEKAFLFEECWYILAKWKEPRMMDALVSTLALQDNSSFISGYVRNLDRLETGQIDLMLKLGGSNAEMFLQILLQNLSGQEELRDNTKYLIQKTNLALCCEKNEELYLEVLDTISKLPEISMNDMRFALNMTSQVTRLVTRRRDSIRAKTTLVYSGKRRFALFKRCKTLKDITKVVSEDRVISVFEVVDMLLCVYHENTPNREDTQLFLDNLENLCSDKKLQKVSKQYLDLNITAFNYSSLEQSDQITKMLKEIKNNDKISTYHENVILRRDKTIGGGSVSKHLYTFRHPATATCTESGSQCGFILRSSKTDDKMIVELSTRSEDYQNTGVHFHDNISAHEMFQYGTWSSNTAAGNKLTVAGMLWWWTWWLPNLKDWKLETRCVAYNITDYHVATQE